MNENFNPTIEDFGIPYDSAQGIDPYTMLYIILGLAIFIGYIAIRVWLSLKKDQKDAANKK